MFRRSFAVELLIQRADRLVAELKRVLHHHGGDGAIAKGFDVGFAEIEGDEFDLSGEAAAPESLNAAEGSGFTRGEDAA